MTTFTADALATQLITASIHAEGEAVDSATRGLLIEICQGDVAGAVLVALIDQVVAMYAAFSEGGDPSETLGLILMASEEQRIDLGDETEAILELLSLIVTNPQSWRYNPTFRMETLLEALTTFGGLGELITNLVAGVIRALYLFGDDPGAVWSEFTRSRSALV